MARKLYLLIFLLAPFLLSGCWLGKWTRSPGIVEENADALAEIQSRQDELDTRLIRLEADVGEQLEMIRALRADQAEFNGEIRLTLLAMQELFTDSRGQLKQVSGQIDRVLLKQSRYGAVSDSDSVAAIAPAIDPQPLYNAAYLDLIRGNYATALLGFESFLASYPDAALSDDARYWGRGVLPRGGAPRGGRGELRAGSARFPRLGTGAPRPSSSSAGPTWNSGSRTRRERYGHVLIEGHPDSVEAPLAQEMLKELG